MTSKNQEAYRSNYKATQRWKKNREKKLEKLLAKQPDNQQVLEAIANIKYRRKPPSNPMWSSSKRKVAKLLKEFSGSCPHNVFSSNPATAQEAMRTLFKEHQPNSLPQGKVDFSLAARSYSRNPV